MCLAGLIALAVWLWLRSTTPMITRLEVQRSGDEIHALLNAQADQYTLAWGSNGNPSGSLKPWFMSQPPAVITGIRNLVLFRDVTDPTESLWFNLTLTKNNSKHEYQITLNPIGAAGLSCIPTSGTPLVAVASCTFEEH